jgi:hypothetical protein
MGEIAEATRRSIPVFHNIGELEDWINDPKPIMWSGHPGEAG